MHVYNYIPACFRATLPNTWYSGRVGHMKPVSAWVSEDNIHSKLIE